MKLPMTQVLGAVRLSVIIPLRGSRGRAELAVRSLIEQNDPIGIEIIAVDDDPDGSTNDYLKEVYYDAVREQRLRLVTRQRRTGDWGLLKNEGAQVAQGAYLSFLHPEETWRSTGLKSIEPLLYGNDLILASDFTQGEDPSTQSSASTAGDGILKLLEAGKPVKSSLIIRRALWDEIGGYPEGYSGLPFPRKLPGDENYELWLKALIRLLKTERRERFAWVPNHYIVTAPDSLLPSLVPGFDQLQTFKKLISFGKLAPKLPKQYWAWMGVKAVDSIKNHWKRRKRRKNSE